MTPELWESVKIREEVRFLRNPPEDDRPVGCGAQCRRSVCVLVTKNRVVRMSVS